MLRGGFRVPDRFERCEKVGVLFQVCYAMYGAITLITACIAFDQIMEAPAAADVEPGKGNVLPNPQITRTFTQRTQELNTIIRQSVR